MLCKASSTERIPCLSQISGKTSLCGYHHAGIDLFPQSLVLRGQTASFSLLLGRDFHRQSLKKEAVWPRETTQSPLYKSTFH